MTWPDGRPDTYDPNKYWDEETDTWGVDIVGKRKYNTRLIVINENNDIYFSDA